MNIKIRRIQDKYLDVSITAHGATIDLGLHDEKERRTLASILQDAIDDLLHGLPEEEVSPS